MPRKLILDVDTGTDDAIAVMLAALHPELDLMACTTVNGNVEVGFCTENTLRVLDAVGRPDIPVHEGLGKPFARPDFPIPRRNVTLARTIHPVALAVPPTARSAPPPQRDPGAEDPSGGAARSPDGTAEGRHGGRGVPDRDLPRSDG